MILPEERVLQTQDPLPDDLNDWPDFTLTDVKVRVAGASTYASLLEARPDYPLSVIGRLSRLDSQRAKLGTQSACSMTAAVADHRCLIVIHPKYTQLQLKIENCTQYAFGQDPSGKSVIWAAGKAGWFEIIPSTGYAPVYDDIVKAIDLVYFLSDAHQSFASRRPIRGGKVDELLALYQQHTDYRVDDDAEAEAVIEKHHAFLIRQMLEGWEGINWARTHLWSYFSRLYPDEVAQVSEVGSEEEDQTDVSDNAEEHNASAKSPSSNDGAKETTWTGAIFEKIMSLKASGHMCKRHCSVDGLAKILVRQYNVASKDEASGIIKDAAESILLLLDADPNQGANRTWRRKVIYRQLQRLADKEEVHEDESANDIATPAKAAPNRRHQKSILRPSTGAGKGKKRMHNAKSPPEDDSEAVDDTESLTKSSLGTETPTKKRRLGSSSGNPPGRKLMNGSTISNITGGPTTDLQQEQLDLIRKESIANGRLHVNHLEALIEAIV
jgi:hypothetical protein